MRKIMPWISINGKLVMQEHATVSALDHGILYGYGVFSTLKVKRGFPLFVERHLQRLHDSIEELGFTHFPTNFDVCQAINDVMRINGQTDGAIRITITPGTSLNDSDPTIIIYSTSMPDQHDFIDAVTIPDPRDTLRHLKITPRIVNMLVERRASLENAQEALFTDGENLVEGSYHNIFSVDQTGMLITPPIEGKGLNGITRQILIEHTEVTIVEISSQSAGPLFLTNSLGVVAIRRLEGRELIQDAHCLLEIRNLLEKCEEKYTCDRA